MKYLLKIENLDCPNCAKALENQYVKCKNIQFAKIDFLKSELTVESDNFELGFKQIEKITKQIEPNVILTISPDGRGSNNVDKSLDKCCQLDGEKIKNVSGAFILDLSFLVAGLIFGGLCMISNLPEWLHWTLLMLSVLSLGYKTYTKAIRLLVRGVVNENLLLTISVVGAVAIGKDMEAIMVIGLYSIGKILENMAVAKSRKSIEKMTNFRPEFANILTSDGEKKVSPAEVEVGQIIVVRPGECVPLDGVVLDGNSSLNVQSLTGESLPVQVKSEDKILSGSIVLDGVLKIKVAEPYRNSTVCKILNLIENNQSKKSKTETVISKMTKYYTLGVIALSILTFGVVFLVSKNFDTAIYRGLIFLVISCPCAFAISVPLSYFSGLGNASSKGILIKGSTYLDLCAKINKIAFDKTGTLTTGKFEVKKIDLCGDIDESQALLLASIGEQYSLHPLAIAICEKAKVKLPKGDNVKEIAGEGVYFEYNEKKYFVGRRAKGLSDTSVELYDGENLMAVFHLQDSIKPQSKSEIEELSSMSVETILLSGDKKQTVKNLAAELGINHYESELLPQEKSQWLENAKENGEKIVGFVGDGLNDAPSLTLSDVGFCMGLNGNPASIEASDIVLTDDNPNKISLAIKISKFTHKIVWQNIFFSAGVKILFLALGAFGVTGMLSAVIADVGVTVVAILNSLRALNYKGN